MNKPHGMSRKDARNMVAIVRQFLGRSHSHAHVEFTSTDTAAGYWWERHDEGYSSRSVQVFPEGGGKYSVEVYDAGRDCDGPLTQTTNYLVGPAGKRKRFYMGMRDWKRNRPSGKFEVKGAFKILASGRATQRDYYAEAAGY